MLRGWVPCVRGMSDEGMAGDIPCTTLVDVDLVLDGDRVIGCVIHDGHVVLSEPRNTLMASFGDLRKTFRASFGPDDAPRLVIVTQLDSTRRVETDARFELFAHVIAVMRACASGEDVECAHRLRSYCEDEQARSHPGRDDGWLLASFVSDLHVALERLAPFLRLLDPVAMQGAVDPGTKGPLFPGSYAALDRFSDPHAPFAKAWVHRPRFRRLSTRLSDLHRRMGRSAPWEGALDVDVPLRRAMTVGTAGSERGAALAFRLSDVLDAMEGDEAAAFGAAIDVNDRDLDAVDVAARCLSSYPVRWVPLDTRGWLDFAACSPAAIHAARWAPNGMAARMLGAKGDWGYLRRRLGLDGMPPDVGSRSLAQAIEDMGDVVRALHRQVAWPAETLAGSPVAGGILPVMVSHDEGTRGLLFDGRPIPRMLELSREWHRRREAIDRAIETAEPAVAWTPGLPDAEFGSLSVKVLANAGELRKEGAEGDDPDGVEGLGHCVGSYAQSCLEGRSRIVSIRRRVAGGTSPVRLSTAQLVLEDGRPVVLQHRGRSNTEPPAMAQGALRAYVADLVSGRLAMDPSVFVVRRSPVRSPAGYDPYVPGLWDTAFAAWSPFLPRGVRRATATELAAIVTRRRRRDEAWLPHSPVLGR